MMTTRGAFRCCYGKKIYQALRAGRPSFERSYNIEPPPQIEDELAKYHPSPKALDDRPKLNPARRLMGRVWAAFAGLWR